MPKRKSNPCDGLASAPLPLNSLDAALDLLVCETFSRVEAIATKFEACAGVKLKDGVLKGRWEEAVKRYWVMKSMDELCCSASKALGSSDSRNGEVEMRTEEDMASCMQDYTRRDSGGRILPTNCHPGAVAVHSLTSEEEREWRKWTPKSGDVVLTELPNGELWPGKIIDKKTFFQGRTVPRGNHFFPVRVYCEDIEPSITVKSRLVPLHLRPNPTLLASPAVQSAYHHAANPTTFDMLASARESLAAHNRTHPGVGDDLDREKIKADKDAWNKQVNWVMNERRIEKMRTTSEERERRLREVARSDDVFEGVGDGCPSKRDGECEEELSTIFGCNQKKRRTAVTEESAIGQGASSGSDTASSIFGPVTPTINDITTPVRTASPSLASFIRPALSTPQRPSSPRRLSGRTDKRRNGIYTGMGEHSPRGHRGGTYTPPRILPSGDETAPRSSGSPAPTLQKFDFVSPLGPVKLGRLAQNTSNGHVQSPALLGSIGRSGSLEVVREEDEEDGWTVVQRKSRRRAGSEPLGEKGEMKDEPESIKDGDAMEL